MKIDSIPGHYLRSLFALRSEFVPLLEQYFHGSPLQDIFRRTTDTYVGQIDVNVIDARTGQHLRMVGQSVFDVGTFWYNRYAIGWSLSVYTVEPVRQCETDHIKIR